ncbi:hypothetical protein RD792_012900 [Penstemon davidsonii]|uniref:C2H2-type domain-containing protein n=1 Tax=Penstemon davidsonii TaxID=160366 RepID=A0ABR0CY70_9LAMI|nr:hypothetical protein RD792_012900 [Penstemon davidsonii]
MEENMSNLTSASTEASVSSSNKNDSGSMYPPQFIIPPSNQPQPQSLKKKRNQPGHPDPDSEVIALSPRTLMATNRFVCEICNKGFQRDQNLQLHRRGHNLPWKLKQRTSKEVRKKVYVCPETSCVHHDPSRALGDLTGIKKHFSRKHGEKKWKCEKCSKKYAVQSDWKAHSKTCGTREYRCDCGTLFSRRDSFITHRAFCDALTEESGRSITLNNNNSNNIPLQSSSLGSSAINHHHLNLQQIQSQFNNPHDHFSFTIKKEQQNFNLRPEIPPWLSCPVPNMGPGPSPIDLTSFQDFQENPNPSSSTTLPPPPSSPHISATALLQKAAQMGAKSSTNCASSPADVFIRPHTQTHLSDFGLNLSSRDEFINSLALYGNKAAAVTGGGGSGSTETETETGGASLGGDNSNSPPPPPNSLFHDILMNNPHPLSFDDIGFDHGIMSHPLKKQHGGFHATTGQFSSRVTAGNNDDGMTTRDFLGLRPLSQSDIMSIAGFSNCMNNHNDNNNACNDQDQTQKSWQGSRPLTAWKPSQAWVLQPRPTATLHLPVGGTTWRRGVVGRGFGDGGWGGVVVGVGWGGFFSFK